MIKSSLWTKAVALGILVTASVIGNVSLSASRSHVDYTTSMERSPADFAQTNAYGGLVAAAAETGTSTLGDELASPVVEGADANQVVPAIYAWDPDVKFVFYRHVSKWM